MLPALSWAPCLRFLQFMQVHALFFASYRDLVGHPRLSVDLADEARVSDLVAALRTRGAPFDGLPATPAVAVNEVYAPLDTPLRDADVVALIPPVAGG